MNWLDTETKALLQREHDPKLAPPKAAEFALVLLRKGADHERLIRAIRRINECNETQAADLTRLPLPATINAGLTQGEALFGQFELICCDAIAAFVRTEVLVEQEPGYLRSIFEKVLQSPEFEPVKLEVLEIPATESGEKFLEQFLGNSSSGRQRPFTGVSVSVPFKKARIMKHWATRVGVKVECDAVLNVQADADIL